MSCTDHKTNESVDKANDLAYHYHYISLDSTLFYAQKALDESDGYNDGKIEAINNIAFVKIMQMHYSQAENLLSQIIKSSDNQIELLVANIQMMRLCQRQSRNKDFYNYYWHSQKNLERIKSERSSLSHRQQSRVLYAETELPIILSAYLYYVGQIDSSREVLNTISENSEIQKDTAQLLNYFYNVGSGDYFQHGTRKEIVETEFEYLTRCYFLASRAGQILWQGNALQSMSEHLQDSVSRNIIINSSRISLRAINIDNVPDSLLAGNFANRAVDLFIEYGDTYQVAGALRTLSDCYFNLGDYNSAILCLNEALQRDTLINQSPSQISAIREKLSINYSAINDKANSDINRNCYLDMHDSTRQDKEFEARVDQINSTSLQMNTMIVIVCLVIVSEIVFLFILTRKRNKYVENQSFESLLSPLETWKSKKKIELENTREEYDDIIEEQHIQELQLERNIKTNIELRSKMSLVNSITPFIDRMQVEMKCLIDRGESEQQKELRYAYILELADKINEYNLVLTNWIQLRKGELSLHIESFKLQDLFDIIRKGSMSFAMKNIDLQVKDTSSVVKADKTLSLFMLNTIADNARKATPEGGKIVISADEFDDCVEISIADNGNGMDAEQVREVFNHQPSAKKQHGFGLMNCKGIIEKYKKISPIFSVCSISAESEKGKGSVFRFRLPKGVLRLVVIAMSLFCCLESNAYNAHTKAQMFADSTYFSNLQGNYEATLTYADSARTYYNIYYRELVSNGRDTMVVNGNDVDKAAELVWLADSLPVNFGSVIEMRNEIAVAALALHQWDLYHYNNNLYSRLYRESSADPSLMNYIYEIQRGSEVKRVAVVLLVVLLIMIFPAYYILYYRHMVYYRYLVNLLANINNILLADMDDGKKLASIRKIWNKKQKLSSSKYSNDRLNDVVGQICSSLEEEMSIRKENQYQMELADDELSRLKYENSLLHINNNVLDNCFSTLKHETMYYPSRIQQIIENKDRDTKALYEITCYYKELFVLLSMQAQKQVERKLALSPVIHDYLITLLRKLSETNTVEIETVELDDIYNRYTVHVRDLKLSDEEITSFFTPQTSNLSCLIIRQIIREVGEITNHRGCGVYAQRSGREGVDVVITLSKKMKL